MASDGDIFEVYLGLPGHGKTISLVEECILPDLKDDIEVWATFWVNWNRPNFHYFYDKDEVMAERNCSVVFDELGNVLDPREWSSEDGTIRSFFQLHRHRHVDLYGSTQDLSLVAKSALIVVSQFYLVERNLSGWLSKKLIPFNYVSFQKHCMTLNDLMLLSKPKYDDYEREKTDDEVLIEFVESDSSWEFYTIRHLLHRELDEYKIEFVHKFCPRCHSRQGGIIPKEETGAYAVKKWGRWRKRADVDLGMCPKHKETPLTIRETAMFDSDYEPEVPDKKVILKAYVKGETFLPYRGRLSDKQQAERRAIKQSF